VFWYRFSVWFYSSLGKEEEALIIITLLLLLLAAEAARPTHKYIKLPQKKGCSRMSRKRGADVGLVGGVGARPVSEVGDKGVGVEDSGGQGC
jgi:hypothetical protein